LLIAIFIGTIISVVIYKGRDIVFTDNLLCKEQHLYTEASAMSFFRKNIVVFSLAPNIEIRDLGTLEGFNRSIKWFGECTNNNFSFGADYHTNIFNIVIRKIKRLGNCIIENSIVYANGEIFSRSISTILPAWGEQPHLTFFVTLKTAAKHYWFNFNFFEKNEGAAFQKCILQNLVLETTDYKQEQCKNSQQCISEAKTQKLLPKAILVALVWGGVLLGFWIACRYNLFLGIFLCFVSLACLLLGWGFVNPR